jgi:hypothetical protein
MVMLSILQIRVSTVFMLDINVPDLLSRLRKRGYVTAPIRQTLEGVTISFIDPFNMIAGKGTVRVDYDFGRRALGIESPNSKELSSGLEEIWSCLEEMNVNIEKALIPHELIVVAEASLGPKFIDIKYTFRDLLGFDLRLMEGAFVREGEDPKSNRWFHLRISPIWSSYKINEKENLYRITIVYREERSKLINFIENIESILRKLLERM